MAFKNSNKIQLGKLLTLTSVVRNFPNLSLQEHMTFFCYTKSKLLATIAFA